MSAEPTSTPPRPVNHSGQPAMYCRKCDFRTNDSSAAHLHSALPGHILDVIPSTPAGTSTPAAECSLVAATGSHDLDGTWRCRACRQAFVFNGGQLQPEPAADSSSGSQSEACPGCGVTDFPHADGCPHEAKQAAEAARYTKARRLADELEQELQAAETCLPSSLRLPLSANDAIELGEALGGVREALSSARAHLKNLREVAGV